MITVSTSTPAPDELLTPAQAAKYRPALGNADWYRIRLRTGQLHGSRVNGRWFTTLDDIDEMVEKAQNYKRRRRNRVMA